MFDVNPSVTSRGAKPSTLSLGFQSYTIVYSIVLSKLIIELGLSLWQRLARQFLVSHRRVINKTRHNHRSLFQIVRLDRFVNIEVGMVSPGLVIDRVLDELIAGQANVIEIQMIRPT